MLKCTKHLRDWMEKKLPIIGLSMTDQKFELSSRKAVWCDSDDFIQSQCTSKVVNEILLLIFISFQYLTDTILVCHRHDSMPKFSLIKNRLSVVWNYFLVILWLNFSFLEKLWLKFKFVQISKQKANVHETWLLRGF